VVRRGRHGWAVGLEVVEHVGAAPTEGSTDDLSLRGPWRSAMKSIPSR
jgi:hypothetical protein